MVCLVLSLIKVGLMLRLISIWPTFEISSISLSLSLCLSISVKSRSKLTIKLTSNKDMYSNKEYPEDQYFNFFLIFCFVFGQAKRKWIQGKN